VLRLPLLYDISNKRFKSAAASWVSKPSLCNLLTKQTKTEAFTLDR
jgi:hypothetical protein